MRSITRLALGILVVALAGCSEEHVTKPPAPIPLPGPWDAVSRLVLSYEQKKSAEYPGVFTGDFTYEFSNATDSALVQQYATGWFKADEKQASTHLFNGYTQSGGSTLNAAASIDIELAVKIPTDDNSAGVDPVTHKILATRVDGMITVPQPGGESLTYAIENNFNVFYIVRGDVAVNLDYTQPADANHWYIYRWVDLTGASAARAASADSPVPTKPTTWGAVKARYH